MGLITSASSSNPSSTPSTSSGIDPRQLDALKLDVKNGTDPAVTRKVAQQFESMFLSMMLKNMRASLPNSDPLASDASKMATDMYDQQLAQNIAGKGRGIGLADALVAQIERSQGKQPSSASSGLDAALASLTMSHLKMPNGVSQGDADAATPATATAPTSGGSIHSSFVERFKDAAAFAAEASGLPLKVLMGQAALESGWGKHEVRDAQGTASFNLFGIKAGSAWTGPTVDAVTTEVIGGVAQKVVQKFRAYASYAESFADYAKMIVSNPRFEKAVQSAGDALQFAKEMGKSGYATDPSYGAKLAHVLTGPLAKLL